MLRTIKRFWWLSLLVAGVPAAWGFSLLGPNANGGDSWQTTALGYNPNPSFDTLATGPKNIGEEYRQNKGVIVYAYDASFLDFFGSASNGVEPADQAFAIMNAAISNRITGPSGLDGYSPALAEFPAYSQHVNYEALALGLTDMKSLTLWALVEQMGLAWPERYVWCLHGAYLPTAVAPATSACPEDEEFEVVQRNLPVVDSLLNQFQYSPYVNDTLYTFDILYWPNCRRPAGYTYDFIAEPVPVDPFAQSFTSVAGTGDLLAGGFYTGLTRDDIAGLRYLLTTNNINFETPAAGSLLQATNTTLVVLTSSDLNALLLAAQTNAPALLPGMFPGVVVGSSSSSWAEVCTTNLVVTVGPPPNGAPYPYNFGVPSYTSVVNCGFQQSYVTTFANLVTRANLTNNPNISLASNNITLAYSTNFVVTTLETSISTAYGQPYPAALVTNYSSSTKTLNVPSGEYLIFPAGACGFNIQAEIALPTVFTTNLVSTATNANGFVDTVSTVTSFTPHQFLVQQTNCVNSTPATGLYEGIEKVQFVRANYDSLIGQFFQPVTNTYTMTMVTNSQTVVQRFQRIATAPDILLTAEDEPLTTALPFYNSFGRSISFDQANVLPNLAGPGTINSPATFTYNKAGNLFLNGTMTLYGITTNSFLPYLNETTQSRLVVWASFDASTNDPVVYPNGTSIQNLVNQMLIQVTPPAGILPDGAKGSAYSVTFTATGGAFSPPYTWSLAPGSPPLPSGLNWTSSAPGLPNDTIAGTPSQAGTFDFTVQLADSLGRSVNWNYQITIH
jgi:hypothetical protein